MKKLIVLALCFGFPKLTIAQETSLFTITFNHVALAVADVDRSAEFYKQTLNLVEITNRTKKTGRRWLSLGEGKELHLIAATAQIKKSDNPKEVHFALSTVEFDNFIKILESTQVNYTDWEGNPHHIKIRADGIKQIYFQDPDGYWIEVNSVG